MADGGQRREVSAAAYTITSRWPFLGGILYNNHSGEHDSTILSGSLADEDFDAIGGTHAALFLSNNHSGVLLSHRINREESFSYLNFKFRSIK